MAFVLLLCITMKALMYLIKHEFRMEFRQKYAIASILLFTVSTIYVVYQAMKKIDDSNVWNAILWIILLFSAFNAIGKSFSTEQRSLRMYLYTTVKPQQFVLAKLIYNSLFMVVLGLLALGVFSLFLGDGGLGPLKLGAYILGVVMGSVGFACLLTLIAGIAAQTDSGSGMTAVLGLPITIPLILIIMRFTTQIMKGIPFEDNVQNILYLGVLNVGLIGLTYLLFPYLWRD